MSNKALKTVLSVTSMALPLLFSGLVLAQDPPSACVELGALAWENWTKDDAGGSGVPAGVANKDYIRCKACHGWDRLGMDGGYARRSRKETRPNAGFGDGDSTSRNISPFMGGHDPVTTDMIVHNGSGRSYADGTGSWVAEDMMHMAMNKAAHANGYTLGNQHPDFSAEGPNGSDIVPTQEQLDCLVEFINFEDGDPSAYFSNINTSVKPAQYTLKGTPDAAAGEAFFNDRCSGCHGTPASDPATPFALPDGGSILGYLSGDGKFSEFAHKTRWGMADEAMTRNAIGDASAADIINLMAYMQQLGGTGFAMNPGLSGNWWGGSDRNGEGLLLEVATSSGVPVLIVSFYTYDSLGNQVWLIGSGVIDGNQAVVDFVIPAGALWGENFDPDDLIGKRTPWGQGTFTFTSCTAGNMALAPNMEMQGNGFTDLEYPLQRDIVTPGVICPTPNS